VFKIYFFENLLKIRNIIREEMRIPISRYQVFLEEYIGSGFPMRTSEDQ